MVRLVQPEELKGIIPYKEAIAVVGDGLSRMGEKSGP